MSVLLVFVIRRQRNLIALPLQIACAMNSNPILRFSSSPGLIKSTHIRAIFRGLSFLPSLSALNWPRINSAIYARLQDVASVLETVRNGGFKCFKLTVTPKIHQDF